MPPLTFFFWCPWAWFSLTGACAVGKVLKPAPQIWSLGSPSRRGAVAARVLFSSRYTSYVWRFQSIVPEDRAVPCFCTMET